MTGDDIANALKLWLIRWAPKATQNALQQQQKLSALRVRPATALSDLIGFLQNAGLNPTPANLAARQQNAAAFPNVEDIHLQDLLTVVADLSRFGPTKNFDPIQTIGNVQKWANFFTGKP